LVLVCNYQFASRKRATAWLAYKLRHYSKKLYVFSHISKVFQNLYSICLIPNYRRRSLFFMNIFDQSKALAFL